MSDNDDVTPPPPKSKPVVTPRAQQPVASDEMVAGFLRAMVANRVAALLSTYSDEDVIKGRVRTIANVYEGEAGRLMDFAVRVAERERDSVMDLVTAVLDAEFSLPDSVLVYEDKAKVLSKLKELIVRERGVFAHEYEWHSIDGKSRVQWRVKGAGKNDKGEMTIAGEMKLDMEGLKAGLKKDRE